MSFLGYKDIVEDGHTVIIFLGHESMMPLKMSAGQTTQTRYGALRHSSIIGKRYGSKISTLGGKGWVYVLHPTPELWTVNLPHRTQVLYFPDISLLTLELELKPGSVLVEAGTGSGSVSHAVARTISPNGHLYTFEFHEQRAQIAAGEFKEHGLSDIVTVTHRDVCKDGFTLDVDYSADAAFLDLPSPWQAIPHAKKILKTTGGRICSFSPCIEQVQRVCVELNNLGFMDIRTVECLLRSYDVRTISLPWPNLGQPPEESGTSVGDDLACATDSDGQPPANSKSDVDSSSQEMADKTDANPEDKMDAGRSGIGANGDSSEPKPKRKKEKQNLTQGSNVTKSKSGLIHSEKCAVPQRQMPGHTGYLTFATLYSVAWSES